VASALRNVDAAAAFLYAPDIPPLKGQSHQGLGEACPRYRWGPFERPTADLTRRFTAWGSRRGHQVAQIQGLSDIAISQRNDAGRPTEFRVVDRLGRDFFLRPIQFRAACNFQPPELPRLKRENTLHSSHVTVWVDSDVTRFTDGRGFGHGVGLGQWEAQDLAEQGKAAQTILQRFYPEAKIERAY